MLRYLLPLVFNLYDVFNCGNYFFRKMDLTGSSVSLEPVKAILNNCHRLNSLNLASCRGLPRGIKRLYKGHSLTELRAQLNKPDSSQESEDGGG